MSETTVIINHEVGLHARPASIFVETAGRFASNITVSYGERTANAKSILSVLTLGVNQGAEIKIAAEGADADEALDALVALINANFGEEE